MLSKQLQEYKDILRWPKILQHCKFA